MKTGPEDHAALLHEQRNHIGIITFNRPEQHNALSPQLLTTLREVLSAWALGNEVRVVIFTGAGNKAFSAGYDINAIETVGPDHSVATTAFANETKGANEKPLTQTPFEQGLAAVKNFPYPTIAMINGHCFGGALHLALNCDLRIAADHISMGMPPAKLGVVYGPEGLRQFIQVLGAEKTRELFFTGRTYRGQEIMEMGLASRLVSASELSDAVFSTAEEIANNAPLALKGIKRIMNLMEQPAFPEELKLEADNLVKESFESLDLKEGQAAFLEKRKPLFIGK